MAPEEEIDQLFEDDGSSDAEEDSRFNLGGSVLRAAHFKQASAMTLYEWMVQGSINVEPDYQRNVVWSEGAQSKVINSWMTNYYVPPLLFAHSTDEITGEDYRTCIDGKQRLTSLGLFFEGKIPFIDETKNKKYYYKLTPMMEALKHKPALLPPVYRRRMEQLQIMFLDYEGVSDEVERVLFERVQRGAVLTSSEKLRAVSGQWSALAQEVQTEYLASEYPLSKCLNMRNQRNNIFGAVVNLMYATVEGDRPSNPEALRKWLATEDGPSEEQRNALFAIFNTYKALAEDSKNHAKTAFTPLHRLPQPPSVAGKKRTSASTCYSPVEFVLVGLLIHHYPDLDIGQTARAIYNLRGEIHLNFYGEKKMNSRLFDLYKSFRQKIKNPNDGEEDGWGEATRSEFTWSVKPYRGYPVNGESLDSESDKSSSDDEHGDTSYKGKGKRKAKGKARSKRAHEESIDEGSVAGSAKRRRG